jgi:tetratricopeptide (TPR) repeat protein
MRKNRAVFVALAGILALSLGAQAVYTAEFVSGTVERRVGSAWKAIEPGDQLKEAEAKSVRLGKRSLAEFSSKGRKISLSAEGSYDLQELFSKPAPKVASALGGRVQKLLTDVKPRVETVAGVRAEEQGDDLGALFQDEYSLFVSGRDAIMAGDMAGGESILEEAWEYAEGSDDEALLARISYYLGLSRVSQGMLAKSLMALRQADWRDSGDLAADYLTLRLDLELQTNSPAEAKALIKEALEAGPAKGLQQSFLDELKALSKEL